ncbi:hypothetical protein DFJ77DRAFT_509702 [Powellomyces hirtus]|nr:hypothetical protein DFJ77DRAFT_509702 [Powellomyces hirtus]
MSSLPPSLRLGASVCRRANPSAVRFASSTTSATKPAASKVDLSKAAAVRIRHPRAVFNEVLGAKRKTFLAEAKAAQEKKLLAAAEEKKRQEIRVKELEEKIRVFKASRAESFSDGVTESAGQAASPVDAITKDKEPVDPIFKARGDMWRKYNRARRQQRFENAVQSRLSQSEQRLESLLYLYHSARDFVTYDNVDEKVRNVHINKPQAQLSFAHERWRILKDSLQGTLAAGRIGVEGVRSWQQDQSVTPEEEQQAAEFMQKRDAEFLAKRKSFLDNSRVAPGNL